MVALAHILGESDPNSLVRCCRSTELVVGFELKGWNGWPRRGIELPKTVPSGDPLRCQKLAVASLVFWNLRGLMVIWVAWCSSRRLSGGPLEMVSTNFLSIKNPVEKEDQRTGPVVWDCLPFFLKDFTHRLRWFRQ